MLNVPNSGEKMYLSIDFEDFNHDFKRAFRVESHKTLKTDALWDRYKRIDDLLKNLGREKGRYATFFCTAVIAEKEPALISQIANDGHEVACHYYYHDFMRNQPAAEVERMLRKAKDILEDVANQEVKGFRAPNFAIDKSENAQYQLVEKFFMYDSSFFCSSHHELDVFKKKMGLKSLKIFPIFSRKFFGKDLRLGGSFLKLFPKRFGLWMASNAIKSAFTPHVYMHPYEFGQSREFKVSASELRASGMSLPNATYWALRQAQWLSLRNNTVESKLRQLIAQYPLEGRLCDDV